MKISIAYYKLKEINEKYKLITNNISIIELGCFPGGWTEYILGLRKKINIVCIDKKKINNNKNINFINDDFNNFKIYDEVFYLNKYYKYDLILSDLCPLISKTKIENKLIFNKIIVNFIDFVCFFLKKNGNIVFKSMDYINSNKYINFFSLFKNIKREKLYSSKKKSSELYLICKNFLYDL
ncbi:SAM-dependent methyltransferase [Candidatus Vidania fulgoroideorum]